jgi:hypothetical protein
MLLILIKVGFVTLLAIIQPHIYLFLNGSYIFIMTSKNTSGSLTFKQRDFVVPDITTKELLDAIP